MATFEQRKGKSGKTTWRVRKLGRPALTKSSTRKTDAEAWARGIEHKLDVGEHVPSSEARKRTLNSSTFSVLARAAGRAWLCGATITT